MSWANYMNALDQACAQSKRGKRDVQVFEDRKFEIRVLEDGCVQVRLQTWSTNRFSMMGVAAEKRACKGSVIEDWENWKIIFRVE